MKLAKAVIPECNVDSCLFNVLLELKTDGVNHTKGNATVIKKVKERFNDQFCIAIIDKDRRDLDFIVQECEKIAVGDLHNYFLLFKRKNMPHYFIQIVPAIEQWIINTADDLEIDLSQTDLKVKSLIELKILAKQTESKKDFRFISLFKTFVRKSEALNYTPLLKLRALINYLLANGYNADLKNFINV